MKKKLCIIGNSVTIRVRPKVDNESDKVYSSLLKKKLHDGWEVISFGRSRYLSNELLSDLKNFIEINADLYIINIGCVDAPPRDIPLWYSDILTKRKKSIFGPLIFGFYNVIKFLRLRPKLVYLRNMKSWVTIHKFQENIEKIITQLFNETNAKIVLIGINGGNDRVEKHLPGTMNNYKIYDSILENVAKLYNINFISVKDLNSTDHFPDGVHYNKEGHKAIFKRILKVLDNIN